MVWSTLPPLVAPQWNGTLTARYLTSGDTVSTGQSVAAVDGVERIAFYSARPFYRQLAIGSSGEDVAALRELLGSRGLEASSSATLDSRDLRSIRAFAASIGVPNATRVAAFDPAWIVYLPQPAVTVAEADLTVGAPAPTAGETLAELEPSLSSARVVERLTTAVGDETSTIDPSLVRDLPLSEGERLFVGGAEIAVSPDLLTLSDEGLAEAQTLAKSGAPLVNAQIKSSAQSGLWLVPAASLQTDAHGATCVLVQDHDRPQLRTVVVIASEAANAVVSGRLSSSDLVGLNARPAALTCP